MAKHKPNNAPIADLLEMKRLSEIREGIGHHFIQTIEGAVIFQGKAWKYDDYLKVCVEWLNLGKKCDISCKATRNFVKYEQARLDKLGLKLD